MAKEIKVYQINCELIKFLDRSQQCVDVRILEPDTPSIIELSFTALDGIRTHLHIPLNEFKSLLVWINTLIEANLDGVECG